MGQSFSGIEIGQIGSGINEAFSAVGQNVNEMFSAIAGRMPDIAAKTANHASRFTPKILDGTVELYIAPPSGISGDVRNKYFKVQRRQKTPIWIGVSPGGGRLFGMGFYNVRKTIKEAYPLVRIDYWDRRSEAPGTTPLHTHFHIGDDATKHPRENTIWYK